jgi:hypothetical protein
VVGDIVVAADGSSHISQVDTHTHTLARGGIVVAARGPAPRLVGRAVGRQMGGREDRHDEAQSARRVLGGNGAVLLAGRGRRPGARGGWGLSLTFQLVSHNAYRHITALPTLVLRPLLPGEARLGPKALATAVGHTPFS